MSLTKATYSMIEGAPVNVLDYGADPTGVADSTAAIQAAINALTTGQTLVFEGNFRLTDELTITNKTRVRLTGNGRIFFDGAPSSAYIFLLVGTVADIEIDHLTLVGDGDGTFTQGAIGCNSGQTISNTRFHDLKISDINVGISHNANLSGSWANGWCYNNSLKNILGTVSGSGYGIQAARAYNLHIYGNTVDNASRHSIYIGRGSDLACLIDNNIIINHRKDVFDATPRCAIDVGRTSGVTISNNTFVDCYDGQIYAAQDTSTGDSCYDILISGNKFGAPQNAVPPIWIGEQLTPTTDKVYSIDIIGNTFDIDYTQAAIEPIRILNGTQITAKNNRMYVYNVTTTLPRFVTVGVTTYLSSDSQIADIDISNNTAFSDSSSVVAGSVLLYIVDELCTGASAYTAKNNTAPDWESEYQFAVTPTNVNSKLKFTASITHTWSVPANTVGSGSFTVTGCKTTSSVTVRPNSAAMAAPFIGISGYAATSGVNTIEMYAVNPNNTTTSTQTNMVHRICVEDF